jgi:hypothetical protein
MRIQSGPVIAKEKDTDTHELNQRIVYPRSVREEEATTRTEIIEKVQLLILSNLAVVTFSCFSEEGSVIGELLLVWERDPVDALQRVVARVS